VEPLLPVLVVSFPPPVEVVLVLVLEVSPLLPVVVMLVVEPDPLLAPPPPDAPARPAPGSSAEHLT